MKVGLDVNAVFSGPAGSRTYVLELLPELIKLLGEQDELHFLHADGHPPPEQVVWMLRGPNLHTSPLPFSSNRLGNLWRSLSFPPAELMANGGRLRELDICHSVYPLLLPTGSARRVLTVQTFETGNGEERPKRGLLRSLKRAHLLVTPAERTKRSLVEATGIAADRVRVVPNGVNRRFLEPPKAATVEALCNAFPFLQEPYLLALGAATEPRRNFPFLLDAYAEARKQEAELPPLVIVASSSLAPEGAGAIAERGLDGKVLIVEGLESEMLPALYRGAEILLYPAFDNAFGQGLLEAAASGVAAIADPSCGVLDLLSDGVARPSQSVDAWAREILQLHREPGRREAASSRARRVAETYTWEESARSHWEAYEALLDDPRSDAA